MGKLLGRIWVTGTVILISFLGFSSQLFIVVPSFPDGVTDPDCLHLLVPFNILLAFLYLNYYLTVTTDPGQVPKGWVRRIAFLSLSYSSERRELTPGIDPLIGT